MSEITTIKITKQTRNRLAKLGNKDETFEQIIKKLLEMRKTYGLQS